MSFFTARIPAWSKVILLFLPTWLIAYPIELDQLLERYQRPTTCLFLDSVDDGVKLAEKYPESIFVLMGGKGEYVWPENCIYFDRIPNHEEMLRLSECEHFDVLYGRGKRSELPQLSEHVIWKGEEGSCKVFYEAKAQPIRNHWLMTRVYDDKTKRVLHSNFVEKTLCKHLHHGKVYWDWVPGINLITFKMLGEKIPNRRRLSREARQIAEVGHSDWMPNNMVLQGQHLVMIDCMDFALDLPRTIMTRKAKSLFTKFILEESANNIPVCFEEIRKYHQQSLPHYINKL